MNNGNVFNFGQTLAEMPARLPIFKSMVKETAGNLLAALVASATERLPNDQTNTQLLADHHTASFTAILRDLKDDVKSTYIFGRVPKWMIDELGQPVPAETYRMEFARYLAVTDNLSRRWPSLQTFADFLARVGNLQDMRIAFGPKEQDGAPNTFYLFSLNAENPIAIYASFAHINERAMAPQEVE